MTSLRLIAPTAQFGFDILRAQAKADKGKNILVSPLSISTALGMAAAGTRGSTQKGMNKALGLPDYGDDNKTNNLSYANLLAALKGKELGVKLSVANAIWAHEGFGFREEFLAKAMRDFKADVKNSDFHDPETLEAINRWVKTNTNDKIEKILEEINPDEVMFLLNALYFKGTWKTQFDKSLTEDLTFHAVGGDKKHPTMFRNGDMRYATTADYQIVALPFGEGDRKRVHLYVLLPAAGKTVEQVVAGLDGHKFFVETCRQELSESEGNLWLPRFKLDYDVELNDALKSLGMEEAFAGGDFSGMHETAALYISKVKHKCIASFDEEGGELAAVTSVGVGFECVAPQPWEMRVDRPFVAVLADEDTGALIGAGVVVNP